MRRALVAAALVGLVACGAGDDDGAQDGPDTTATPGELVYLLPAEGGSTSTHPGRDREPGGFAIVLGRPDGDAFTDIVAVFSEEADADREVAADEEATLEHVDVRGHDARLSREGVLGASVDWFDGRRTVGVLGPDGDVVLGVARALDVEAGTDGLAEIPDGYEVIDAFEAESGAGPFPSWDVDLTEGSETLTVRGSVVADGFGPALAVGIGDRLEPVVIRGADGIVSTSAVSMDGLPSDFTITNVAWLERPNLLVTIQGSAPLERLLEVAESLREVAEEEFLSAP